MNTTRKGLATRLIHTAEGTSPGPCRSPRRSTRRPRSSSTRRRTCRPTSRAARTAYFYSRYDNPSLHALEAKLAEAEDAEAAMVFASGMGAIASTLLSLLSAGDEVVCSAAIYGGTLHLLQSFLARFGVTTRFVDLDQLRDPTVRHRPGDEAGVVRVADQSDAAVPGHRPRGGGVPYRRRPLGDGQHLRDALQPASADARRRPGDAQRHQVPQRAQRRDRGRDHGIARAASSGSCRPAS